MQVLKEAVRQRIRAAALAEFAKSGAGRATMNAIAQRADVGAATLYNYYDSKQALLLDVIPPELAKTFEDKLERRVRALAALPLEGGMDVGLGDASGEDILTFWLKHRLEMVVLLDRSEGTRYAGFGARFVRRLTRLTSTSLRSTHPGLGLNPRQRLVLTLIFENTRRTLATLLEQCSSEPALREALRAFWSYQIPGLRGFATQLAADTTRLQPPRGPAPKA